MTGGWKVVGVALAVVLWLSPLPALASIHQYDEGVDRVMYRSLQTLRDQSDQAWQVVLFKRIAAGTAELHLRLIGFPGVVELQHPRRLKITTGTDRTWTIAELTTGVPIAANLAEYDVRSVLAALEFDTPLRLEVSGKPPIELAVPPFIVREWRRVADSGTTAS